MTTKIQTKYGTAHVTENGHLQIKTHDKGHYGEYLHRLIVDEEKAKQICKEYGYTYGELC